MKKIKLNFRNVIYSIVFLFRPIIPIAFGFILLVLTCALLVVLIFRLDINSKLYEVLLAILTGVTASLLISIIMELYNNYRFSIRRQRELREYFGRVASYENHQNAIMKTNSDDEEADHMFGDGRAYAVFYQLNKFIPTLREALKNRDYLYKTEIDGIDDILYLYYHYIVEIIRMGLLGSYTKLVSKETNEEEIEDYELSGEDESGGDFVEIDELINGYPMLLNFLKKESLDYLKNNHDTCSYDENYKQLGDIIENAIFYEGYIFKGYFEITDTRYELVKSIDNEEYLKKDVSDMKSRYEFRSNMISHACGDIDKIMIKLQKRVAKEPYFWVMAKYKERRVTKEKDK